jgi:hypothetical protein
VIDRKYLDKMIRDLTGTFGVRENLDTGAFYEIASHSTVDANKVILEHLGIRDAVEVDFVNTTILSGKKSHLQSRSLHPGRIMLPEAVEVEVRRDGSYREVRRLRIPAFVKIEVNTRYLKDIRTMGAIFSHEDTHLFLWLTEYPRQDEIWHEIETDVACIVFGLGTLVINGRDRYRGDGLSESMGYLDDESFNYVQEKISKLQMKIKPIKIQGGKKMVKCGKCGYDKNPDGEKFCQDCGTPLEVKPPVAQVPPPGQNPAAAPGQPPAPQGAADQQAGATKPAVPKAKLIIKRNGRVGTEFVIDQESITIGRWDADSGSFAEIDLSQDDAQNAVSRKHAKILFKDGEYFIEDTGSVNGTYINKGPRLIPGTPQKIKNGDEIIIGRIFMDVII